MTSTNATSGQLSKEVTTLGYSAQGPYAYYQTTAKASTPQTFVTLTIPIPLPSTAVGVMSIDMLLTVCSPSQPGYWVSAQEFLAVYFNNGVVSGATNPSASNGGIYPGSGWLTSSPVTYVNATPTSEAYIQLTVTLVSGDVIFNTQAWTNLVSTAYAPSLIL